MFSIGGVSHFWRGLVLENHDPPPILLKNVTPGSEGERLDFFNGETYESDDPAPKALQE
jgi:hypothetical protein